MVVRLTTAETQLIESQPGFYVELPLDMSFLPIVQIPDALEYTDYVLQRVERPAGSLMGEHSWGVATSKTPYTRPILSYRYTYSLSKTELAMASRNGYDIIGKNIQVLRSQMQRTVAQLFFQGAKAKDRVTVLGAFTLGEDTDATLDGEAWDTATKPLVHIAAGFSDLIANLYDGPYSMVLSSNLKAGMLALNNAANPRSHEEIALNSYLKGGSIYYMPNGDDTIGAGGPTIFPLQKAAADDGVWMMFAPKNSVGENNFWMAEVTNGIEVTVPSALDENNMFSVNVEWRGAPIFRGADSAAEATYITYEPDVDLA